MNSATSAPTGWQKLIIGGLLAVIGFALALWEVWTPDTHPAAGAGVVLDRALVSGSNLPLLARAAHEEAENGPGTVVELPHRVGADGPRYLRYELAFTVAPDRAAEAWGICILRSSTLAGISLDGAPLRLKPGASLGQHFRVNPIFQSLPGPLAAGQHRLEIFTQNHPSTPSGLARIRLGPEQVIHQDCQAIEQQVRQREAGSFYLMSFIGALTLSAALVLRNRSTLYIGLIAATWLVSRYLLNSEHLVSQHPFWTWLLYLLRPLVVLPVALYCLDASERLNVRNLKRLMAFFAAGYLAFLFTPMDHWNDWLLLFGLACIVLLLGVSALMVRHTMRQPGYAATGLAAALGYGLLANATELMRGAGLLDWAQPSVTHWTIPALCVGLGVQLLENMYKHVQLEQAMSRQLRHEVEQQRLVLESEFRKAKVKNERIAVFEERKRIMREMHDGLGSQLVSASALLRHPQPDMGAVSDLLDSAIQEMRIFLDVLSTPHDGAPGQPGRSLNVLLAKLRHHIEPLLRSRNIDLQWDVDELPDELLPSDRARINLLRLLQEAVLNAVKHAQASTLAIRSTTHGHRFVIEVRDNGVGMVSRPTPGAARQGYGLAHMRKRASLIGAELAIEDAAPGTSVCIALTGGPGPAAILLPDET
jgi:signal transduction histidine kinase